jgi:carbonic anhydrase
MPGSGAATWDSLTAAAATAPERLNRTGDEPLHRPSVAVLACSDARVPPTLVFDQPAGELFVVRVAGNTATPTALASLDYAVEHLGVELVVVLGHTACGAIGAALAGACEGTYNPITGPICALARRSGISDPDELAARNVIEAIEAIGCHDGPAGEAARAGTLTVRGAIHDVRHGALHLLETSTDLGATGSAPSDSEPSPGRMEAAPTTGAPR